MDAARRANRFGWDGRSDPLASEVTMAPTPNDRTHFLCERCGGTGRQEDGKWSGTAYDAPAGVCDLCSGSGWSGPVPAHMIRPDFNDPAPT